VLTDGQKTVLILASRLGIMATMTAMICLDPYTGWPALLCAYVAGLNASSFCHEFPEFWSSL
jgi:hypothetical protein